MFKYYTFPRYCGIGYLWLIFFNTFSFRICGSQDNKQRKLKSIAFFLSSVSGGRLLLAIRIIERKKCNIKMYLLQPQIFTSSHSLPPYGGFLCPVESNLSSVFFLFCFILSYFLRAPIWPHMIRAFQIIEWCPLFWPCYLRLLLANQSTTNAFEIRSEQLQGTLSWGIVTSAFRSKK